MEGRQSILDRIGKKGLVELVFKSSPGLKKVFSVPYGLIEWGKMLDSSSTREEFKAAHRDRRYNSSVYFYFSPKYRRAGRILRDEFQIE